MPYVDPDKQTQWRLDHVADRINYDRLRYLNNKEAKIKQASNWQREHKDERKIYMKEYNKNEKVQLKLWRNAKKRAKDKGLDFDLEVDQINIPNSCPFLGIPLYPSLDIHGPNSPSIDKLDASKGYTKDNTNVISHRANKIKSNATFEEFELIYFNWKKLREKDMVHDYRG